LKPGTIAETLPAGQAAIFSLQPNEPKPVLVRPDLQAPLPDIARRNYRTVWEIDLSAREVREENSQEGSDSAHLPGKNAIESSLFGTKLVARATKE
jgi:hypothetical protein